MSWLPTETALPAHWRGHRGPGDSTAPETPEPTERRWCRGGISHAPPFGPFLLPEKPRENRSRKRRVEVAGNADAAGLNAEFAPRRRARRRDQPRHGNPAACNCYFFTGCHLLQQSRQMSFGFMDIYLAHWPQPQAPLALSSLV